LDHDVLGSHQSFAVWSSDLVSGKAADVRHHQPDQAS
jgi:hypothetical protein